MPYFFSRRRAARPQRPPEDWLDSFQQEVGDSSDSLVVVDLGTLETIGSNELSGIVKTHLQLSEQGRKLRLTNATSRVAEIFEITRLDRLVEVVASQDSESPAAIATA